MLLLGEGQSEAKVVVAEVGGVVVTVRRATEPRVVVPATAAVHAVRPTISTRRIGLRGATIAAIPVTAPLPNIATHIIQAQLIRLFRADSMSFTFTVAHIPSHIVYGVTSGIFVAFTLISTSGGIFPLRFSRQAEVLSCKCIQLCDEGLTIIPRDLFYRQIVRTSSL